MDFFGAQDSARRRTRRLLILFTVAVAVLVLLTNLVVALFLRFVGVQFLDNAPRLGEPGAAGGPGVFGLLDPAEFLVVGAVVCAGVGAASLFKHLQLARGGRVVAEMLGGRRLAPDSREPAERRLLNVVEEMGIAAGVPVPPVYVLPEEGINAFAAGHGTGDAVIGVTEGGMRRLSRDELQGVVAHEYSHVLNGDMRLNLRLIAALNGILFIAQAGRVLLRAGRSRGTRRGRGDASAVVLVLGLALLLIGLVGVLFARLIKAGVSREREYLADASAVQFTRNPDGLAGALRQIGGLAAHGRVLDPQAETASHMFLVHALGGSGGGWFATHPPLEERIRRLDPAWNGELPVLPAEPLAIAPEEEFAVSMLSAQAAPMAVRDVSSRPTPGPAEVPVPAELLAGCRNPELAQALVLNALIAAPLPTVRQQEVLEQSSAALPAPLRAALSRAGPLQVVALAMPALKHLDAPARTGLIASATRLAELDERLDLREIAIAALLAHHLGEQSRHGGAHHPRIGSASRPLAVLLAALAQGDAGRFAAAAQAAGIPGLAAPADPTPGCGALSDALASLRGLYPLLKPRVLKACLLALGADAPDAAAVLGAIALSLDCPVPTTGRQLA